MPTLPLPFKKLLYQMLWGQYEPDHGQALLNYARQQRELHQQQSATAETETYREWLAQASLKGHRGLFRSLRKMNSRISVPFNNSLEKKGRSSAYSNGELYGDIEKSNAKSRPYKL